jgi:hypothetical protein
VQFFTNDDALIHQLADYVGRTLVTGDASAVIATDVHREGAERVLAARGFDTTVAKRQGRYVVHDAASTLSQLVSRGTIDPARFETVIGGALRKTIHAVDKERPQVSAFGEMVGLLWPTNPRLAIHLEELWNDLQERLAFSLCCAYPMKGFATDNPAGFLKVCAQHSHVFPASPSRESVPA